MVAVGGARASNLCEVGGVKANGVENEISGPCLVFLYSDPRSLLSCQAQISALNSAASLSRLHTNPLGQPMIELSTRIYLILFQKTLIAVKIAVVVVAINWGHYFCHYRLSDP